MTTIDHAPDTLPGVHHGESSALGQRLAGVANWLTSADHKRVGRLFLGAASLFAIATAVVAALVGFERVDGDASMFDSNAHGQLVAAYRVGLVHLVVGPIVAGLAIAIVPLQLGARAIAFGRAAAFGFWAWLAGAILTVIAIASNGGPGGGNLEMVDLFIGATALSVVGLAAAMGSVVTSVLTTRAPGMTLRRVPMFSYSALVGGAAMLLALAAQFGHLLLLLIDRNKGNRMAFGGNKGLFENENGMLWMLGGLSLFVFVLPLVGMIPDILGTITGKHTRLRPVMRFGVGLGAVGALGAVSQRTVGFEWNEDKVGRGVWDLLGWLFFNGLPLLGVLIVIAASMQMVMAPKPNIKALTTSPVLFSVLGGMLVIDGLIVNALTGIGSWNLIGTAAEEAVAILLGGGAILLVLAGVTYWGPKLWGRSLGDKKVLPLALLGFGGAFIAGVAQLLNGFGDQIANATAGESFKHDVAPELMNTLAGVGMGMIALAVLAYKGLAAREFGGKGAVAGDDPWDGQTLEWATSSPPPTNNFADVMAVSSAFPLTDLKPGKAL